MAKKIPKSRKHKKLKFVDPCYKGDRQSKISKKVLPNAPPTANDFQEIPHGVKNVMNWKNNVSQNRPKRRKKKSKFKDDFLIVKRSTRGDDVKGATKPLKTIPSVVKQERNESQKKFFNRLQQMANRAITEATIEEKYKIELLDIDEHGNAKYVPAAKETSTRKQEKRKQYNVKKLEKKRMKTEDEKFELKREQIQFGDVVTAPPSFTAKPRKAPERDKPGKKDLALKNILESQNDSPKSSKRIIKWKTLPEEERKSMENERLRAIKMYRLLKSKKQKIKT